VPCGKLIDHLRDLMVVSVTLSNLPQLEQGADGSSAEVDCCVDHSFAASHQYGCGY
jgi:hypothetical protein